MYNNQLVHSGTLGMKWGKRLYQYKDGSLTPLGRLRYGRNKEEGIAKHKANKETKGSNIKKIAKNSTKPKNAQDEPKEETEQDYYKRLKSKDASELTDAELSKLSNRILAENTYRQRLKDNIPPEKHARIKKVIADVSEKAVRDISGKAIEAIGQKVSKTILGGDDDDATKDITKITKDMDLSKVSDSDLEKIVKRAQNERKFKVATDFINKDKNTNTKTEKKTETETETETETKSEKKDESKSGTVENDNASSAKGENTTQWGKRGSNIVDGEYRDITDNPGSNNGSMKQLLLEDKKRKR